jgi:CheY-like chemotaxis protein
MVDALSSDDLLVKLKAAIIRRPIPEEVYFLAQEIRPDFYPRVVKPELLAAVRSVVSNYPMVSVPEKSAEIASKVQAVVVEKLKGRHLEVQSVTLADRRRRMGVMDGYGKRVLVADGDEESRSAVATVLEEARFVVYQAEDGRRAVEELRKRRFDAVMLDRELA